MWLLTIMLVLLVVYLFYKWVTTPKHLDHIPGPKPWPIIGNVLQIDFAKAQISYMDMAKRYGPVFKVRLGRKDAIVVSNKKHIQEVLGSNSKNFSDRPKGYLMQSTSYNYSGISFMNYGREYSCLRKHFSNSFKQIHLNEIDSLIKRCITDYVKGAQAHQGMPFDPYELLHTSLFEVNIFLAIGATPATMTPYRKLIQQVLTDLLEVYTDSGVLIHLFPCTRHLNPALKKKINKANKTMDQLYQLVLNTKVEPREKKGKFKSLIDTLRQAKDSNEAELTEDHLKMMLIESMITGTFLTVFSLYAYFNIAAHYPKMQRKIQEEIEAVIGHRRLEQEDRDSLPYLQACILELIRFNSNTPVSRPHTTSKDTKLGKYLLPKGTDVMVNYWALHHDPRVWKDPHVFRPERYLRDDGSLLEPGEGVRAYDYGVGSGVRSCPGHNYAKAMMFLIIGTTAQNFTIKAENGIETQPSCDPLKYKPGLVTCPKNYKVRLEPRVRAEVA